MKKIYTLLALAAVSFGANAQYDVSAEYVTLTPGSTVSSSPIDISFTITNQGAAAIPAGDTLMTSYTRNGTAVYVTDVNLTGVQFLELTEDLAPGASVGPFGFTALGVPSGFMEEFCVVVYGIGAASIEAMAGDDNTANNTQCVTLDVTEGFDVGIEDLESDLTSVYVSAGQLMIVNNGSEESEANVNIINMNGQTVQAEKVFVAQGTNAVDMVSLPAGMYVVSIEIDGNIVTKKVTIQ